MTWRGSVIRAVRNSFSFYRFSANSKSIGPLRVNDLVVSTDGEMVEVLNNEFKSVFTIEDQKNIVSMQPKPVTSETISQVDSVNSEIVLKIFKENQAKQRQRVQMTFMLGY